MESSRAVSWTKSLSLFAKLGTATLVVLALSRARPVLMPIAFAGVLAFILTPPLKWLRGGSREDPRWEW